MNRSEYLVVAEQAIQHVKAHVKYRALNTPGGWIRNPIDVPQKFSSRLAANREVDQFRNTYQGQPDPRVYIDQLDRIARASNTGNCSDLSAVAFKFLESQGIRPIDYFGVERSGWGHAFVILNRDSNIPLSDFASWSAAAVLCDPQYDRGEIAGFLAYRYPHALPFTKADAWFRID